MKTFLIGCIGACILLGAIVLGYRGDTWSGPPLVGQTTHDFGVVDVPASNLVQVNHTY